MLLERSEVHGGLGRSARHRRHDPMRNRYPAGTRRLAGDRGAQYPAALHTTLRMRLMDFIVGFLVWTLVGLTGAFVVRAVYGAATVAVLTFAFGLFGAFIGGMLGTSAYIFHNPVPLRVGGILGAAVGGLIFPFLYHFIARKAV
jgi:hypothetical protein